MDWLSTFASGGQDVRRCQPIFKIYWEKYQIKTSNLLWWRARACFNRSATEKPNLFQKLVEKMMSDEQTTFAFLVIALVLIDQIGHAIYQITDSFRNGHEGSSVFLEIWNQKKYQKVIIISFVHLKKLDWFPKEGGCSSKITAATPILVLKYNWP